MRFIPKQPSIADEGLKVYLDRTQAQHNGYGYDEFVKRIELGEPKTIIANAFSVDKKTVYRWIAIHNNERVAT